MVCRKLSTRASDHPVILQFTLFENFRSVSDSDFGLEYKRITSVLGSEFASYSLHRNFYYVGCGS